MYKYRYNLGFLLNFSSKNLKTFLALDMRHSQRIKDKIQIIWEKADVHKRASEVGIPVEHQDNQICQCCDHIVEREKLSMWEHTKQLQIFGFGYPLWFTFLKYCILLVVVLIASKTSAQIFMATQQNYDFCYGGQPLQQGLDGGHGVGLLAEPEDFVEEHGHGHGHGQHELQSHFNLFGQQSHEFQVLRANRHKTNSMASKQRPNEEHHHPVQCTSFMVFFSIFKGEKMYESTFLKIVQFTIHLLALIYIRNMILKEQQYYDQRTTSISDYTMIVSNLPEQYGVRKMVTNMMEKQFGKTFGRSKSTISQMLYVFQDDELNKINDNYKKVEKQLLDAQKQDNEEKQNQLEKQLKEISNQRKSQSKRIRKQMDRDHIKCDKIIVVFSSEADKANVLQQYDEQTKEGRTYKQYFNDKKVKLKQAPEPNEIIWEHIDESDTKRSRLIIQGWILTFLFLLVVFVVFYFILLAKTLLFLEALERQQHGEPNAKMFKAFSTTIVFLAIFGVLMFNKFVMGKVLHVFVHMEKHAYTDKQSHSFSLKYALGMFFTTALMTLAVEALTFGNFYAHQFGVIEEQTIMFMVTAFFIPFVWIINPYNLIKRWQCKKKYKTLVSQKQANELIEPFPYDLGKRYAEILEIMWFTFLYSELIPLGSFLTLIGLSLYFWIDKYNFLHRSTLKAGLSGKMAILGLKSLDATLFLSPAGAVLFDFLVRKHFDWVSLIFALLGIVYMIIPITSLIWKYNGQKFLLEQKPFQEGNKMFRQTYMNEHPVYSHTHKKQIQEHKSEVHKHYKDQLQTVKIFGAGRGAYMKDTSLDRSRNSSEVNSKKG